VKITGSQVKITGFSKDVFLKQDLDVTLTLFISIGYVFLMQTATPGMFRALPYANEYKWKTQSFKAYKKHERGDARIAYVLF